MSTYIPIPGVQGVCVHNTDKWQITELMGGLACELLQKTLYNANAIANERTHREGYPVTFMQGDEACDFLKELREAQDHLSPEAIDKLLLSAYE